LHRYTIDQIKLFAKAAVSNKRQEMADMALAARIGVNADQKQWKEFIRKIEHDSGNDKKEQKPIGKQKAGELKQLLGKGWLKTGK